MLYEGTYKDKCFACICCDCGTIACYCKYSDCKFCDDTITEGIPTSCQYFQQIQTEHNGGSYGL